jgi:hypothetical protein
MRFREVGDRAKHQCDYLMSLEPLVYFSYSRSLNTVWEYEQDYE